MTQMQRRTITLSTLAIIAGVVLAATDAHRLILAAAWPHITNFFDYYIGF